MKLKVNAEYLFEFDSFQKWVNKASSWFKPYRFDKVICVDKNGYCCNIGEDFMKARDNNLFPVKAYRLLRTIEMPPNDRDDERSAATDDAQSGEAGQQKADKTKNQ